MPTTLRRCCGTCRFYRAGERPFTGWCAHPARKPETDVTPWLRARELACRVGWSLDLWVERPPDEDEAEARVVGLVVWGPIAGDATLDELPGDLIGWLLRGAEC
jgi:hypothetical protein